MYIVKIANDGIVTEIHGRTQKLTKGSISAGLNSIDSFTFSLLPSNAGFALIRNYKTLVSVYNTNKKRYEFFGRVLATDTGMSESGLITKDVTCESLFGFLCDSIQPYVEERNWTVRELFKTIISNHNEQVESYKQFAFGYEDITAVDLDKNVYCGIQRKNTWETLKEKFIDVFGGEFNISEVEGGDDWLFTPDDFSIFISYVKAIGSKKTTEIALSRNMQSITNEKNPADYITRLIPLGCKLKKNVESTDENGNITVEVVETEQRLEITEVNGGKNYIDDEEGVELYGIHVGTMEWDDVTLPANLLKKGRDWLTENNKIQVKYTVKALDLSLLGLDIDDFCVGNWHPLKNSLLGIDDDGRIIKKTIDICDEINSSFEIGEKFKTASDILQEQINSMGAALNTIAKIEADYVTNQKLNSVSRELSSLIRQTASEITLGISSNYVSVTNEEEYRKSIETQLALLADEIVMKFTTAEEKITAVGSAATTEFEEIYKYISFKGGAITLGNSSSAIKLEIVNDRIAFKKNGVVFSYWDGDNFNTGNIVLGLDKHFILGNYAFKPREDGSVMVVKVG